MPEFLVELYVSREASAEVRRGATRARAAADALAREGAAVRYVRPIFVPADETCFHVYEATSLEVVREAARRAQLPFDRVVQTAAVTNRTDST